MRSDQTQNWFVSCRRRASSSWLFLPMPVCFARLAFAFPPAQPFEGERLYCEAHELFCYIVDRGTYLVAREVLSRGGSVDGW